MVWTKRSYQYDAQGSTRALHDDTGTITDTFTYDAWGNEVAQTGTTETPFRWNGRVGYYWDGETETYQVRRRPYLPIVGRWVSRDPIWSYSGVEMVYASNNPTTKIDPSGLQELAPWDDSTWSSTGIETANSASELVWLLAQYYSLPFKDAGRNSWFDVSWLPKDWTYHEISSRAFDESPLFQQAVQIENLRLSIEVIKIVRTNLKKGMCSGKGILNLPVEKGIDRRINMNIFDKKSVLGFALASPHRVDVGHWVEYSWNSNSFTYSIDSHYEWHDEFDWRTWSELRTLPGFHGQVWALIEGQLNWAFDIYLDMEYYFTVHYSKSTKKTQTLNAGDCCDAQ